MVVISRSKPLQSLARTRTAANIPPSSRPIPLYDPLRRMGAQFRQLFSSRPGARYRAPGDLTFHPRNRLAAARDGQFISTPAPSTTTRPSMFTTIFAAHMFLLKLFQRRSILLPLHFRLIERCRKFTIWVRRICLRAIAASSSSSSLKVVARRQMFLTASFRPNPQMRQLIVRGSAQIQPGIFCHGPVCRRAVIFERSRLVVT